MKIQKQEYGIRARVALPYDEALAKTKAALQAEGFGVLSEIDMKAKLKEKLGVEIKQYMILGACNPPLAYKAVQAEPEIGLLLPCNVIVYDAGDGATVISAIDPDSMSAVIGDNPEVEEVARDARVRLERVIGAMRLAGGQPVRS
ncbi:MAG TPA: DUF302 domain-containing protein [Thermoanaerobaculia bacterium]|jgi:uncharacterized protein (DUF302 family)|nr:DUF302 domain-containing protein [Thermoanaerobaculia bacterium]